MPDSKRYQRLIKIKKTLSSRGYALSHEGLVICLPNSGCSLYSSRLRCTDNLMHIWRYARSVEKKIVGKELRSRVRYKGAKLIPEPDLIFESITLWVDLHSMLKLLEWPFQRLQRAFFTFVPPLLYISRIFPKFFITYWPLTMSVFLGIRFSRKN